VVNECNDEQDKQNENITSLPTVMWQEGRVAAPVSHTTHLACTAGPADAPAVLRIQQQQQQRFNLLSHKLLVLCCFVYQYLSYFDNAEQLACSRLSM